jgi:hypothetical protein
MPSNFANGRTLRERVLSRLIIDPSGCLLWTGAKMQGYGHVNVRGQQLKVHRLMYEWFVGPIPDGMDLDHLCRVTHCGAPAHLEPVTRRINTLRGVSPPAVNAQKTHCPQGHEYDLLNTYWNAQSRHCRTCHRHAERRRKARIRAGAL